MQFDFATAGRIVFGEGMLREAAPAAAQLGRRALVVTGSSAGRVAPLVAALDTSGVTSVLFPVAGEPSIELIRSGAETGRAARCDVVVAIGGGSALDAGKGLAAL